MRISDWSSDVCSSDLLALEPGIERIGQYLRLRRSRAGGKRVQLRRQVIGKIELMACLEGFHGPQDRPCRDRVTVPPWCRQVHVKGLLISRSDERRVGKEGVRTFSSWWSPSH